MATTQKKKEIPKTTFVNYLEYINSKMSDGDIFSLIRQIEIQTTEETGIEFSNWDELYIYLKDHRDTLTNG